MKTKIVILSFAFVLLSISVPIVCAQDADKAAIDKYISAQAKRERGEEYPEHEKSSRVISLATGRRKPWCFTPSKGRAAVTGMFNISPFSNE